MMMNNGRKKHATVSATDGVNYRDMAAVMTELGYPMFHSSARNNVIRVMQRFVEELNDHYDLNMSDEQIMDRARSPEFQAIVGQILNRIDDEKKLRRDS